MGGAARNGFSQESAIVEAAASPEPFSALGFWDREGEITRGTAGDLGFWDLVGGRRGIYKGQLDLFGEENFLGFLESEKGF